MRMRGSDKHNHGKQDAMWNGDIMITINITYHTPSKISIVDITPIRKVSLIIFNSERTWYNSTSDDGSSQGKVPAYELSATLFKLIII
jgi:hypothetical protein